MSLISKPLVAYAIKATVRDRLILSLLLMMVLGTSLSVFLSSAAISEQDQFLAVFASASLRILGAVGLILFISFYMRRSFDNRDVDYLLSRPISRPCFILSHATAFTILAVLLAAATSLCVGGLITGNAGLKPWGAGFQLWSVSIVTEFIIIANAAFFFAMVLPSAAAGALASLGLYVFARLIGQFLGIVDATGHTQMYTLLGKILDVVSIIVPRLDLMGQTSWLVYGPGTDAVGFAFVLIQGAVFTLLVILAAMVDLVRRQF